MFHRITIVAVLMLPAAGLLTHAQEGNKKAPSWLGQYESGPSRDTTHIVTVGIGDGDSYIIQWNSCATGQLVWYGELAKDGCGFWIETYPNELSPTSSLPYHWRLDSKGNPDMVRRENSEWFLRRIVEDK